VSDRVTVTVEDSELDHIDDIAKKARNVGMHVEQVLSPIGVIIGTASPAQRASIGQLAGVADVAEETSFQLPGPGEKIQ
jgi:hypothetical protein